MQPPESPLTLPQALRVALSAGPKELKQLSAEVSASEKQLPDLLGKLERTLRREGARLRTEPPQCLVCRFAFEPGGFKRPSRCPKCRSERLSRARYWIEG